MTNFTAAQRYAAIASGEPAIEPMTATVAREVPMTLGRFLDQFGTVAVRCPDIATAEELQRVVGGVVCADDGIITVELARTEVDKFEEAYPKQFAAWAADLLWSTAVRTMLSLGGHGA